MKKIFYKIPVRIRMILATPLVIVFLAMFMIEMVCRAVRGVGYITHDLYVKNVKPEKLIDYMYRRDRH